MEKKEIKLNEFECLFAVFMAFKILEMLKEREEQRRKQKDEEIEKIIYKDKS